MEAKSLNNVIATVSLWVSYGEGSADDGAPEPQEQLVRRDPQVRPLSGEGGPYPLWPRSGLPHLFLWQAPEERDVWSNIYAQWDIVRGDYVNP